ncbi:uncharacterized protein EI90DRAFT_3159037 [Cantharellus anzutake]|uniref:uncharacterized protein n=1 Tax=Cantharellus anzutake TaxID=1750568 RepID=UPI001904D9C2|nr:uncharacterized protein EI90DRAFT_3159037 [Cantharellus anzutake]KAF8315801.1 hypothetical protein EI90DRAFT_3159037 [Cantharellus anzutake]
MNVVSTEDDLSNYLHQATAVSREHPVVISKYIEEAKEIEMDAIAKNGKLVMHYISEHIENAGVHSGDATLVLPPQDLDPETVRRIEDATRKIGNALNVTGPFNIQFIAKNNDIKVIECNLRAARSFPFVSKVTGVDAIEMATKVMLDLPVVPYPDLNLPPDYVGVKVPQFSFNRLSGADPVLGVEMASTGEVACFGKNKYEAYLKALISTGIVLPEKNILLSIGSFKEKLEMLPSVQKLHQAGYNLLGTAGTADFFTEHNIPCKYLEALPDSGSHTQKSEYSLTQHLANNMIDLYINLPSKNNYRRPATYTSKGYRTRRMAVDFAVPLITNVKIAKLLAEALVRKMPLEVSPIDFKTSHTTFSLPGLINVQAFVPRMKQGSRDFELMTKASVSAGFTTVQIMPFDVEASVTSGESLDVTRSNLKGAAYSNYALSIAASATNASTLDEELQEEAKALFIPFNGLSDQNISKVAAVAAHFAAWPKEKPIITDARATDLATILLLASLHNRSVHVADVGSKEDIQLIALSKERGLKVTCDVSVYSLFFTREQYPASTHLPTFADQQALWSHLSSIDVFAVGTAPYRLALDLGESSSARSGIEETLPLLLTAQSEGQLTLDDIRAKLHDNPLKIFELPEQPNSQVEVEINRRTTYLAQGPHWSPLQGVMVKGCVHRVVLQGQTVYLDGVNFANPLGRDVSGLQVMPIQRAAGRASSFIATNRPSIQVDQLVSPTLASASRVTDVPQAFHLSTRDISPNRLVTLPPPHPAFHRRSILSVKQFSHLDIHQLFDLAHEMRLQVERNGVIDVLRGRILCNVFYEPSTRTSSSFESAMKRLGGEVVTVSADRSSVAKGESLADTIRTLACYGDAIVLRHPTLGAVSSAAKFSPVPIINAGDGVGEHPTQALLDIFTIRSELGTVNGKTITLLGDLKNGRTVHSLVTLLCFYSVRLNFVSPPELTMPDSVTSAARRASVSITETNSLNDVLSGTDVLYVTRVQQERFTDLLEWERVHKSYVVDHSVLARAKADMIVMHPLPRLTEIDPEVDFDSRRAVYFRQMRYGLFVRMALLAMVMG